LSIIESRPDDFIRFKLDFLKTMAATDTAAFTFNTEHNQTTVTWCMYGKNNFMGKAMGLIMSCDKTVGGQFEKGLLALKSVVEEAG